MKANVDSAYTQRINERALRIRSVCVCVLLVYSMHCLSFMTNDNKPLCSAPQKISERAREREKKRGRESFKPSGHLKDFQHISLTHIACRFCLCFLIKLATYSPTGWRQDNSSWQGQDSAQDSPDPAQMTACHPHTHTHISLTLHAFFLSLFLGILCEIKYNLQFRKFYAHICKFCWNLNCFCVPNDMAAFPGSQLRQRRRLCMTLPPYFVTNSIWPFKATSEIYIYVCLKIALKHIGIGLAKEKRGLSTCRCCCCCWPSSTCDLEAASQLAGDFKWRAAEAWKAAEDKQ